MILRALMPLVALVEATKDLKSVRQSTVWSGFRQVLDFWTHPKVQPTQADYYALWWDLHDLVEANLFGKRLQLDLFRRVHFIRGEMIRHKLVRYQYVRLKA